ncbi:MAG: hypothetical protein ACOVQ0_19060 [Novosphingobium sp.]|uniref:hypothetical protein n=1 Tax=Novosphingobium sp. TaxID=1874826 RepID=UPI003B9DC09F
MEVFPYIVMFLIILIGASCIIFGQKAERYAGIVILVTITAEIILFSIFWDGIIKKDLSYVVLDLIRFSAFFTISLKSVKIWPTFCSGILLVMLFSSIFKNFNFHIGVFGEEGLRVYCSIAVYSAVSIGLMRNNIVRR